MISPKLNLILLTALTLGLAACQGKNPFDRSNEPTKEYSDIKQDSPQFQDLKVEKVDNGQSSCGKVYDMEVKEAAARNLIFIEGQERSYNLRLRSYITNDYQLVIAENPDTSLSLRKIDNQGNWNITWRPKANTVDRREGFSQKTLTIGFKPNMSSVNTLAKSCLTEVFLEEFNVTVNLNRTQPTLSIEGINDQIYRSTQKNISFKVFVTDPSSSSTDIPYISFAKSDWSSPEHKTVELRPMCSKGHATKDGSTWQFNCDIDLSLIQLSSTPTDHNKIVEGQFFAIGQGVLNRTPELKRTIRIQIDNPPPAPVEPAALEKIDPDQAPSTGEIPIPTFRSDIKPGDQQ